MGRTRRTPAWWIHLGFPLHFPADVDHQAGVRRVRPIHRPQEVLLSLFIVIIIATPCLQRELTHCLIQHSNYWFIVFRFWQLTESSSSKKLAATSRKQEKSSSLFFAFF